MFVTRTTSNIDQCVISGANKGRGRVPRGGYVTVRLYLSFVWSILCVPSYQSLFIILFSFPRHTSRIVAGTLSSIFVTPTHFQSLPSVASTSRSPGSNHPWHSLPRKLSGKYSIVVRTTVHSKLAFDSGPGGGSPHQSERQGWLYFALIPASSV